MQRLENLGWNRLDNAGIEAAVARAGLGRTLGREATPLVQPLVALETAIDPTLQADDGILTAGELAIIAYNTAQSDATGNPPTVEALRFVALAALPAGQVIYFTDRTWNGSAFTNAAGDGTATYTVPGGGHAAGTSINLTGAALGTLNLDEISGDTIYVYTGGIDAPTRFLFALEIGDGGNTFNGSLTNTGLTNGVNAVAVGLDSASYHGPTSEAAAHLFNGESLIENISDFVNWEGDNRGGQNALDQVDHIGPYYRHADFSIWSAAIPGGDALVSVHGDATVNSGLTGFNLGYQLTLDNEDLADTLANPRDIAFDPVRGLFFVVDTTGGLNARILQGNISDLLGNPGVAPALTTLYTSNQPLGNVESAIRDLQIDTTNGIIYFMHGSRFEKIVMNTAGQTSTVLANFDVADNPVGSSNNFMDDFVINFATGNVYLTSHRVLAGQDGDEVTKNFLYRINGLDAGDGTNAFTFPAGNIVVMPFSPDDDDVAHPLDIPGEAFPQERGSLEGVALSADGNTLYFTTASILWDHDGDGGFSGPGGFGTPPQLRMGGVYSYALTGNANGNYTQIYQQVAGSGPQGLLDDIEVDHATGTLYFLDQTGEQVSPTSNPPGDEGIWRILPNGTGLGIFQLIHNVNSLAANGIYLNNAPTATANLLAASVTEASNGPGSGITGAALLFSATALSDINTSGGDELRHAVVRISDNFLSGATHQDLLRISGNTSGTVTGITYNYNSATGVMTLNGAATVAEYAALLNLVTFSTSGDNVTDYGNNSVRTIAFTVSDGLNFSDEITNTVSVTGINDAPVNTITGTATGNEDTTFNVGGISVFDVDADPANEDIRVTLSVSHGTINVSTSIAGGIQAADITGNNGASVVIVATQNQINATFAAATGIMYTPTAHFNGSDTMVVTTNDLGNNGNEPGSGGTGTGTDEEDQDNKSISITAVNDAPTVIGDGGEDTTTIFEDQPSATGQLISALLGGQYSDELDNQIPNGGASAPGQFSGIAVVINNSNAGMGQWQYSTNGGGSWQNIGAASTAVAKLFNATTAIRFNPAQDYNGPEPTLVVHLMDNSFGAITDGTTTANLTSPGGTTPFSVGTVTIGGTVSPVNDPPTQTLLGGDIATWTEGPAVALLDVGSNGTIDDIDSLNFDTGTLTVLLSGGVPAQDGLFVTTTADITFTATTVSYQTVQFATYVGGGFGGGNIVFTFDANATPDAVQALVRALAYNNNAGDNPTAGTRSVTWTLVDGDGDANNGEDTLIFGSQVTVVAVNDNPVIANLGGDSATYTEQGPAVFLDATVPATVTDPDHANFNGGNLTVSITANEVAAEDVLAISTAGTVTLSAGMTNGSIVSVGGLAVGTITSNGAGGADLVVAFNTTDATPAAISTLIQALTYNNTNTLNPSILARTVSVTVSDGGGGSDSENVTINVVDVPENAAPVVDLNGAGGGGVDNSASYTEQAGAVLLAATDLIVTDADDTMIESASVQITTGFVPNLDSLTVNGAVSGTIGGITFSYHPPSGVLTLTGSDTLANYQAVLRQVGFESTSNDPGASRTVRWTVNDGTDNSLPALTTITITEINDEPTLLATGNTQTLTEGGAALTLFTGIDAEAIEASQTFVSLTLTVTNVADGASEVLFFDGSNVALVNGNTVTATNGLTVNVNVVSGTATVTFTGAALSEAALETLLAGLTYINTSQDPTDGDREVRLTQLVDSGSNVSPNDSTLTLNIVSTVNVDPVNDGPGHTVPGTQTFNEDGTLTFSTGTSNAIVITDLDADPADVTVTLTIADGALTLNAAALPALTSVSGNGTSNVVFSGTVAEVNAALNGLVYAPPAHANGGRTLNVSTNDNGNSPAPALSDSANITINITAINDAPVLIDTAVALVDQSEDDPAPVGAVGTLVSSLVDLNPPAGGRDNVTDPDAASIGIALTAVDTASGSWWYSINGGANWIAVGAVSTGSALLLSASARLYFQPTLDFHGTIANAISFRAWDGTSGTNGGTANTVPNGGTTAFSTLIETASLTVTPDNIAPVVDLDGVAGGVNAAVSYTENTAAIAIGSGIVVSDADSGIGDQIVSAVITLTDAVAGDTLTVLGGLPGGIVAVTTTPAGQIVITLSGAASQADYATAIGQIRYASTSDDPTVGGTDPTRTITVTVNDGDVNSAVATSTVTIAATDDLPVAQPDSFTITESGSIVAGNLFANNGSGADTDPDGPPLAVSAVNGSSGNVGLLLNLASGAQLTVNANGTFNYNPLGFFLPTPTAGSGAVNTPGHDSFTYTLAGGNTVTVSITLTGLDTDDVLIGTAGTDILIAGVGNDELYGFGSNDSLTGGAGVDTAFLTGPATFTDLANSWLVQSPDGNDILKEVEIVDEVSGQRTLLVGSTAFAGVQAAFNAAENGDNVRLATGNHTGTSNYDDANLTVIAHAGAVINAAFLAVSGQGIRVFAAGDADSVTTGSGEDLIDGGGGADTMAGGAGNDTYVATSGDAVLEATAGGYDIVYALDDHVLIAGQEVELLSSFSIANQGDLDLTGNDRDNVLSGTLAKNVLIGGGGFDVLNGFAGDDIYIVDTDDIVFEGGATGGFDIVYALADYALTANQHIELLSAFSIANQGALNLTGNVTDNTLVGSNGANTLDGKEGNDYLVGFGGADNFAFTTALNAATNADKIEGFEAGVDKIVLENAVFAGLADGALSASQFVVGPAALDADDRIIYNQATAQLFYDADGNGAGAAVLFATMVITPTLSASDFNVI